MIRRILSPTAWVSVSNLAACSFAVLAIAIAKVGLRIDDIRNQQFAEIPVLIWRPLFKSLRLIQLPKLICGISNRN